VAADQWIGREILGYRLESLIGRGGMGVVYRAYDLRLKRSVALKLVAPELSQDERFRERFLAETELVTSLEHPNVVPIYDAGDVDGQLYLAMRYVEGSDLKSLLTQEGPLEPAQAIAIAAQVGAALDAAHRHGLVHRDVKPSNVLLDTDEHVYLTDFGLARRLGEAEPVVATEVSLGTPAYASPEQIAGGGVDGRADVYALGCLLYECLAGTVPYPHRSELAVLWAHLQEAPPGISAYRQLEPVLSTALAKDRDDRYQTCGELVEAAREALGLQQVVVVRDRRSLLLVALGALVLAGALAGGLASALGGSGPTKPSTKPTATPRVDSLQHIDPKTNALAATIRIGHNLDTVAAGAGRIWAGSVDDQSVLRIDPKTNEVSDPITTIGPDAIAVSPDEVYVANTDGTLIVIDPSTLEISKNLLDSGYRGVAADERATWTVGFRGLLHLDHEGTVVSRIRQIGSTASAVATGGGAVWALDDRLRRLWRVDPRTDRVAKKIRLGFDPGGLAVGLGRVWVTNNSGAEVVEIDPATNRIVHSIPVGDGPIGVAVGEGSVWTANYLAGTVSRIDPQSGRVVKTVKVGPHPSAVAVGEGGVWVAVRAS
jgi:YVTN family beta-propeller protein